MRIIGTCNPPPRRSKTKRLYATKADVMTTWYAAIYIVPDEVKTTANRVSLTTKEDAVIVAQDEKDKCAGRRP